MNEPIEIKRAWAKFMQFVETLSYDSFQDSEMSGVDKKPVDETTKPVLLGEILPHFLKKEEGFADLRDALYAMAGEAERVLVESRWIALNK